MESSKLKILLAVGFLFPIHIQPNVFVMKALIASFQHAFLFALEPFLGSSRISDVHDCCEICRGLNCTLQLASEIHKRRMDSCKDWEMVISSLEQVFESNSGKADSRQITAWYQNLWWFHFSQWLCASSCTPEVWLPWLEWCYTRCQTKAHSNI